MVMEKKENNMIRLIQTRKGYSKEPDLTELFLKQIMKMASKKDSARSLTQMEESRKVTWIVTGDKELGNFIFLLKKESLDTSLNRTLIIQK